MANARSNRVLLWVHASATILWALLSIPTLIWWRESILWVAFMSLYANVASHWAAWQATRAEKAQQGESQKGTGK